jgi:uncharacterized alpha-E superfamily protein
MKVNMLSRVADGMFWLDRYMERTDGMMLTLNTFYILSFDKEIDDNQGFKPLLEYYTDLPKEKIKEVQYDTTFILKYIICDSQNHNSVKNLVIKARENARLSIAALKNCARMPGPDTDAVFGMDCVLKFLS